MAQKPICSVAPCGKPVKSIACGMCDAHYRRNLEYGSPFGGRTPRGERLRWISDVLMATETDECVPWPFNRTEAGYPVVHVDGRSTTATRVICEKVEGPPMEPWYEAAHSCGKGHEGCVNHRHLRWATPVDNRADMREHGTYRAGSAHFNARLTEDERSYIKASRNLKKNSELARELGVSTTTISRIQHGHGPSGDVG